MRKTLTAVALILLSALVVVAQDGRPSGDGSLPLNVELMGEPLAFVKKVDGKDTLCVTVQFQIVKTTEPGGKPIESLQSGDQIVVTEEGREVKVLEMFQPTGTNQLAVDLAMDISGSMIANGSTKYDHSRSAGREFLKGLHDQANAGLILFNHQIVHDVPPSRDRESLLRLINGTKASGGTAYLDATFDAVNAVSKLPGRKAVLVMTDGVDINSTRTLEEVIAHAVRKETRVYTLGVGEPGKNEPVSTVLVLDYSGSMDEYTPAAEGKQVKKIVAMKDAATRFVDIMRPGAEISLLPFSTDPDKPRPFTADKQLLKDGIKGLEPKGETALYDATFNGVMTLDAARRPGKKALVVLTDGIDSNSHAHNANDVIKEAKRTNTPLHMLGLGKDNEIRADVMRNMAEQTGGTFHHVKSYTELVRIFEELSINLHDEGIDEKTLKELADKTGGKYFLASDVSKLQFYFQQVSKELQSTFTVTYVSPRQVNDGTFRRVGVSLMRNGQVIGSGQGGVARRGVLFPEMDTTVYLVLLGALAAVLLIPTGLRALYRLYGGT